MSIEVVFEKRINNANVYRDVDVAQRKQYFLLTFLSAIFVLGLLTYGYQQYRWISLGYEIESAKAQKDDLLELQRQLILERESVARPEKINWIAQNQLGMVIAAPGQIVSLNIDEPWPMTPAAGEAAVPLTASKR